MINPNGPAHSKKDDATAGDIWVPDILGEGFSSRTIALGTDPDGETDIVATLVRYQHPPVETNDTRTEPKGQILYLHGFSDYFFQRELAYFCDDLGYQFYGIDLRKYGRSLRGGHTPCYSSNLELYDQELDAALAIMAAEHPQLAVVGMCHSTGGAVMPLWIDRLRARGASPFVGLVCNSPWLDMPGPATRRSASLFLALKAASKVAPMRRFPLPDSDAYGVGTHIDYHGEFDYNTAWKPIVGFPARLAWLVAVRRCQLAIHRGIDVGVPVLILRSDKYLPTRRYSPKSDTADVILDPAHMALWGPQLGHSVTDREVPDARHDVFLSLPHVRAQAYAHLKEWISQL